MFKNNVQVRVRGPFLSDFFLNKSKHWFKDKQQVFPPVLFIEGSIHGKADPPMQFCGYLLQWFQNHNKTASKQDRNNKRVQKFPVSNLCVSSKLEPKSPYPDPLNYKQFLLAHLAKVVHAHFDEDSYIQQVLIPARDRDVLADIPARSSLLLFMCYWQKHSLHLSRGRVSKTGFSLRHKHIAYIHNKVINTCTQGKGNSYCKLMCATL